MEQYGKSAGTKERAVLKANRYVKVLLNRKNKKIPKCCGSIKKLKMDLIFGN